MHPSIDRSTGRWIGRWVGRVGSIGRSVGRSVGQSVGRSVSQPRWRRRGRNEAEEKRDSGDGGGGGQSSVHARTRVDTMPDSPHYLLVTSSPQETSRVVGATGFRARGGGFKAKDIFNLFF